MWLNLILVLFTLFLTAMLMVNIESFLQLKRPEAMPHRLWLLLISVCVAIMFIYGSLYLMGYDVIY